MLIKDLEQRTKLDRATIRFYEREGLIIPNRQENGYRTYCQEDCETLLKIKLLRQLEMPLEKIKELQQGSSDLNSALLSQISLLNTEKSRLGRAINVCTQMSMDNARFETLDAQYYLDRLYAESDAQIKASPKDYQEPIQREYHPFRRYFARILDNSILNCVVLFFCIIVFRLRLENEWVFKLVGFIIPFLAVPINALMLHFWGTTPGKWCMGIRVESENGGLLSIYDALEREKAVLSSGLGYGIPIYSLWRLFSSYKDYEYNELFWDDNSEYIFKKCKKRNISAYIGIVVFLMVAAVCFAGDLYLPRHRGDLEIREYAENYNYYLSILNQDYSHLEMLQTDGSPFPQSLNEQIIHVDAQPQNKRDVLDYTLEGEMIRSVQYQNHWTQIRHLSPLNSRCRTAAITAVMSQDGMTYFDLIEFINLWNKNKMLEEGNILYKNVEITWMISAENCMRSANGVYYAENEVDVTSVTISFEINFLE